MNPLSLTGKGFELLGALSYERKEHRIPSNDNYYNDYYDYCGQVLVISDIDLEKERLYSSMLEEWDIWSIVNIATLQMKI